MSREFPDFIDPWRAAEGGKRIGGTIPLARLKRLTPLLASNDGEAAFDLQFGYDAQRRATVTVEVSAPLRLTCQRSLEPYVERVAQRSLLQIIGEPGEQALLSGDEEFVLVEEGRVAVADLVEDELILALPQVPRNPQAETVWITTASPEGSEAGASRTNDEGNGEGNDEGNALAEDAGTGGERQRPFEGLAEMLKNK